MTDPLTYSAIPETAPKNLKLSLGTSLENPIILTIFGTILNERMTYLITLEQTLSCRTTSTSRNSLYPGP